ncbi:SHOCT domain-containing protein, partial [Bacillus spizizenii]|nr:SHOCT domain-containing protein [Bacillus spizizenii]
PSPNGVPLVSYPYPIGVPKKRVSSFNFLMTFFYKKGKLQLAFLFKNEEVYNSVAKKKRKASGGFRKTYYAAQPLLGQKNQVMMEVIFGYLTGSQVSSQGLFIATKENLHLVTDKAGGHKIISWNYDEIKSISVLKQAFTGFTLEFKTVNGDYLIKSVMEGDHEKFINYVRKSIIAASKKTATENISKRKAEEKPINSDFDFVASEIRKYATLKDEGLITEEEFTAKKKKLLNI